MKRMKLAFAVLAVVFAATTAFKPVQRVKIGDRTSSLHWFEPNGSFAVTDERGWSLLSPDADPGCNSTSSPCAIQILADDVTYNIDDTKFANLKASSQTNNFTVAGTYTDGKFEEQP